MRFRRRRSLCNRHRRQRPARRRGENGSSNHRALLRQIPVPFQHRVNIMAQEKGAMNSRLIQTAFSLAMVLSVVTAASSSARGGARAALPPVRQSARASNDAAVAPFAIHVPDDVLKDLTA